MGTMNEEIQQLVQRAEHAVATLQPELACKFYERALEKSPEETSIMDSLGELFVGLGQPDRAKQLFDKSTSLQPDSGPSKWLYLAQLQEGWEAKQSFCKGIELLLVELKEKEAKSTGEEDEEVAVIKDQVCSTYCSIAELYLTDLCFEPEAEKACEEALQEALKYDQGSAEMTQALANLRLSQVRGEEAAKLMCETYRRLKNYEEESLPGLAFRVTTAKLLLECAPQERKCARKAVHLLEMCKCEDDENAEIWYLLGVAYFTRGKPDLELARAHLECAQGLLKRAVQMGAGEGEVREQLRLVDEQLLLVREAEEKGECEAEEEEEESSSDEDEEEDGGMEESGDEMEQDDA